MLTMHFKQYYMSAMFVTWAVFLIRRHRAKGLLIMLDADYACFSRSLSLSLSLSFSSSLPCSLSSVSLYLFLALVFSRKIPHCSPVAPSSQLSFKFKQRAIYHRMLQPS
jgi:hypothetical protein